MTHIVTMSRSGKRCAQCSKTIYWLIWFQVMLGSQTRWTQSWHRMSSFKCRWCDLGERRWGTLADSWKATQLHRQTTMHSSLYGTYPRAKSRKRYVAYITDRLQQLYGLTSTIQRNLPLSSVALMARCTCTKEKPAEYVPSIYIFFSFFKRKTHIRNFAGHIRIHIFRKSP